jgi:hypothetical protein
LREKGDLVVNSTTSEVAQGKNQGIKNEESVYDKDLGWTHGGGRPNPFNYKSM